MYNISIEAKVKAIAIKDPTKDNIIKRIIKDKIK
jgi:hypothetical protein